MQISKWGNMVEALELHEGDDIEVIIADERIFQVKKKTGNEVFLTRLRQFRGKLPADFTFDRDDASNRG